MAEHDINLVTSQAGTVIAENLKVTLGTAEAGSLTPSTITAMVGIANNTALQIAEPVQIATTKLQEQVNIVWPNAAGYIPGVSGPGGTAATALSSLTTFQNNLGFGGSPNHGAFGSFLTQAKNHISDSIEVKKAVNFMSSISFSDLGSGIKNVSSMATQGLNEVFGSLTSAASVMIAAGPCFDLGDMRNFGKPAGLVSKLQTEKLANFSGVSEQLAKNGVDLTDISNPVYEETIRNTLKTITDPAVIATVTEQLEITPYKTITSLNDYTDLNKLANPADTLGFTGDLTVIGTKFNDLGASFPSPQTAANMLSELEVPTIPTIDSQGMSDLMSSVSGDVDNLIGAGTGELGVASMTDFVEGVAGGPTIDALVADINASTVNSLISKITSANQLFAKAGVDFTESIPNNLGTAKNFATSLHKFGQDPELSGLLGNMAVTGSQFGDAIKASLSEGKNKALMATHGIKSLDFKG